MIRARSNPHPRTVCWSRGSLEKQTTVDRDDYRFYARVLRVIYNKPKLRKKVVGIMREIENTRYYRIPDAK